MIIIVSYSEIINYLYDTNIMEIAKEIANTYSKKDILSALIDLIGPEDAEYLYTDSEGNMYTLIMRLTEEEREVLKKFLS